MKGITPVIAIILLLLVTISIVGFSFTFLSGTVETLGEGGQQALEHTVSQMGQNFKIEGTDENTVYVRNLGTSELSSLTFFVDNTYVDSTGSPIPPNSIGAFVLNDSKLAMLPGNELKVSSSGRTIEKEVNFYQENTVAYWKFDEGADNITYDSAGSNHAGFISQRLDIDESINGWSDSAPASPTLETTDKKQGSGAIRANEPTNQWAQIAFCNRVLDVSQWEQPDNRLTGKLHYWIYVDDVSLSYPTKVEFGEANNAYQAYWSSPVPVSGSWQSGWNLLEMDFQTANYVNLGSIDWTQERHFEFYVNINDSIGNYVIFDDFRINDNTAPAWIDGRYGYAMRFDGSDDVINLPPSTMNGLTEFTVEYWMLTSDTTNDGTAIHGTDTGNNEFGIFNYNSLQIFIKDSSWNTGVSLTDGTWKHIVVTRDSSSEVRLYVDGSLIGSSSLPAGALNINCLVLGQEQDSLCGGFDPSQAFNGNIDEVRILNIARSM